MSLAKRAIPLPARLVGLLCLLAASASSFAGYGDRWMAKEADVPLLSGPDHSYSVLARLGPTDVVSQESNRVIRGFLKVKLARDLAVVGYVEEASLLLVERFDPQPRTTREMPINPARGIPTSGYETRVGTGAWVAIAVLVVLGLIGGTVFVLGRFGPVPRIGSMPLVRGWVRDTVQHVRSAFSEMADWRGTPAADRRRPPSIDARDLVVDLDQHLGTPRERGRRLLDAGEVNEALWAKAMTLSVGNVADAVEAYLDLWVAKHWSLMGEQPVEMLPAAPPASSRPREGSGQVESTVNRPRVGVPPIAARRQDSFLLPLVLVGGVTLVTLLAGGIFLWQVTFFVVPPIGAVPEGATIVAWRLDFGRLVDSPDATCERKLGGVSPLCRAAAISAFADAHDIITRLPYSETLYDLSFSD